MTRRLFQIAALALPILILACSPGGSVKIGAVVPLTGQDAVYGVQVDKGAQLAFEQIRADKSYPYPLELLVRDSGSDPQKAKEGLDQVFEAGALAAIGGVTSKEAKEMVDVADQYDRILLSPSASSPELTSISKNFYRVFPSDFLEGSKMGNFATQTLGLETVVILAAETLYGRGSQEVFKAEFERYGGQVLEVIEYPENTTDFSGLMDRVITLNPQAVYLADFASPLGQMVLALRNRNFDRRILTTSAFATPDVLAAVGDKAEGIFLTQTPFDVDSEDPHIRGFVDAYRAKYGEDPDLYAAHGYDAMIVLAEALKRAGRAAASEVWKGMRQIQNFPGVTGIIQFDERGDVQKFPRIYTVSGGKLVDYDRYVERRREELLREMQQLREQMKSSGDGG